MHRWCRKKRGRVVDNYFVSGDIPVYSSLYSEPDFLHLLFDLSNSALLKLSGGQLVNMWSVQRWYIDPEQTQAYNCILVKISQCWVTVFTPGFILALQWQQKDKWYQLGCKIIRVKPLFTLCFVLFLKKWLGWISNNFVPRGYPKMAFTVSWNCSCMLVRVCLQLLWYVIFKYRAAVESRCRGVVIPC